MTTTTTTTGTAHLTIERRHTPAGDCYPLTVTNADGGELEVLVPLPAAVEGSSPLPAILAAAQSAIDALGLNRVTSWRHEDGTNFLYATLA